MELSPVLYPTIVEVHGEVGRTWVVGINIYDKAIELVDFFWVIKEDNHA